MELTIEKPNIIEDGKHYGMITAVEYRTKPYEYTDLVIEFEQGKKIKYGLPTQVSEVTKLGKLLLLFGAELPEGQNIDPEKVFVGKGCQFMTMTNNTGYATVVKESILPRSEK